MADSQSSKQIMKTASVVIGAAEREQLISVLMEQSLEEVIHDILVDVHKDEKTARIQSAVVEIEQKVENLRKEQSAEQAETNEPVFVETDAAKFEDGNIVLKGNPFVTVRDVLCPNCRLPRLLYPRVGFNSRNPPDPNQQYCKNEPAIIIDKHDVHGQRKKGVKVKGQVKNKNKKKAEAASPASSASEPATPSRAAFASDSFEFKEIEYPAAKCPNKDSHLGDHWKSVNVFATHLNGSCYLKRDRAAGREAVAKISGTPKDSRASSPKPSNGVKRARPADDNEGNGKKKQKVDTPKKLAKKTVGAPSRLREASTEDKDEMASSTTDASDTIQVVPKAQSSQGALGDVDQVKAKINGTAARKKPPKATKKGSSTKAANI